MGAAQCRCTKRGTDPSALEAEEPIQQVTDSPAECSPSKLAATLQAPEPAEATKEPLAEARAAASDCADAPTESQQAQPVAQPEPEPIAETSAFAIGDVVVAKNLVNAAELNERTGTIRANLGERFSVDFGVPHGVKNVRPVNLVAATPEEVSKAELAAASPPAAAAPAAAAPAPVEPAPVEPDESPVLATASAAKPKVKAKAKAGTKKAPAKSQPRQGAAKAKATSAPDASCPSSQDPAEKARDLKAVQRKAQSAKAKDMTANLGLPGQGYDEGERELKKFMFISFYREQYAKMAEKNKNVDMTKFYEQQAEGLTITDGHRPMVRPDGVAIPPDYKKKMGTMTIEELKKYNCDSKRMMISIHGDIFDVSDRPDKYSASGPYWHMAGHDITWGLMVGQDIPEMNNQFYDVFKFPVGQLDRKLQGIMSWWCFYEREYGDPVGKLAPYAKEWDLPAPPQFDDPECSIM